MRIIIDILLLLILAYCTWMGYKKGFINTCVSILAIVVALYAGSLLSSAFSSKIIPAFQPFAGGIIESKEDRALAGLGYNGVSIEDIVAQNPEARTEYCMAVLEQTGIHYRRADNMTAQAEKLADTQKITINEALEQVFCRDILYVAGTVLGAVLILILFAVIASLANLTFHIPNVPRLEVAGGVAAGFFKGFFYCVLLCWLLSFCGLIIGKQVLTQSLLTRFFLLFEFLTAGIL